VNIDILRSSVCNLDGYSAAIVLRAIGAAIKVLGFERVGCLIWKHSWTSPLFTGCHDSQDAASAWGLPDRIEEEDVKGSPRQRSYLNDLLYRCRSSALPTDPY
jgi:hypothetical protein